MFNCDLKVVLRCVFTIMLCAAGFNLVSGTSPSPQPNIILAIADDMGWAALSSYGHSFSNTKHLDAMTGHGVKFNRFYAAFPVCTPTRASVLTGRVPARSYCVSAGSTMPIEERTLAEILKDQGYVTGHIGKWHLGGMLYGDDDIKNYYRRKYQKLPREKWPHPRNQGFDYSFSIGNLMDNYRDTWAGKPNTGPVKHEDLGGWNLQENGKLVGAPAFKAGDTSMILVDKALEFIGQANEDGKPFFLCIWFNASHGPYVAEPENEKPFLKYSEHSAYWGEVRGIDLAMGRLRDKLKTLGIYENTLNWFCADNGNFDYDNEHGGLSGTKGGIEEGGIRVAGIVEYPNLFKPQITDAPAGTVDITPTICDLLNITMPRDREYDGVSVLPQLQGKDFKRSKPLNYTFIEPSGKTYMLSMIDQDWKLI